MTAVTTNATGPAAVVATVAPPGDHRGAPLPVPPSDEETALYAHRQLPVLLVASLVSLSCLVVSQWRLIGRTPWIAVLAPFLVFTVGYYLISLRVSLFSRNFDFRTHQVTVAAWNPVRPPSVDVWLPICGEDRAVLANTWAHVRRLADSYDGVVEVHVLDDADDPEAAALAAAHGFRYLVRPDRGWMKKAGNLRHAYRHSDGDFVLILDADFAPRPDFLRHTLPYMLREPGLGIVQTPQYFRADRRQTWMERGAGSVQELFYRVVQVSRDRLGGAICVGSCALYRRAALDTTGGTTLIEHSEDVHTGFDLRRHGWGLRYLPVPLATGLCPSDPDAFFTQQYRWCTGSMSLLGSRKFWGARLRPGTLCCYLSGFSYYIHTALATFVGPLIPIALLWLLPHQVQLHNYLWIAPSAAYTLVIFPLWHNGRYGPTALMAKGLYGWAHVFALADILRGKRQGWQTTGARGRRRTRRMWIGIGVWGGATAAAWLGLALYRMLTLRAVDFVFLLGVGLIYAATCVVMPLLSRRRSGPAAP